MPLTSLVARTYLRYVLPATLLSALLFTPLLWLAMKVPVPGDAAQVKGVIRTGWLLAGLSLVPLLVLIGAVSPAVRSISAGTPASQVAALRDGALAALRAIVPCAVAVIAIVLGLFALAIPGLLLLVLLALTGAAAAPGQGLGATLAEGVAAVRARLPAVAGILAGAIAITIGALVMLQAKLPLPLPKQPSPELLATFRLFARYAVIGVALIAPLPAIALAALTTRPTARA